MRRVVLDTNVLVAGGFRPTSASAALMDAVRRGELAHVWNGATRGEAERVLSRIPRLDWTRFKDLYRPEHHFEGRVHPDRFAEVPDPTDRKFAALARATASILVTSDDDLLAGREHSAVEIVKPSELVRRLRVGS